MRGTQYPLSAGSRPGAGVRAVRVVPHRTGVPVAVHLTHGTGPRRQLQALALTEAGALRARTDALASLAAAGEHRVPGAPPAQLHHHAALCGGLNFRARRICPASDRISAWWCALVPLEADMEAKAGEGLARAGARPVTYSHLGGEKDPAATRSAGVAAR